MKVESNPGPAFPKLPRTFLVSLQGSFRLSCLSNLTSLSQIRMPTRRWLINVAAIKHKLLLKQPL